MRVLFFMRIPAHWVTRFLPRAGLDLLFINRLKMLSSALGVTGGIRIHDNQSHNLVFYLLNYGHMAEREGFEPSHGFTRLTP